MNCGRILAQASVQPRRTLRRIPGVASLREYRRRRHFHRPSTSRKSVHRTFPPGMTITKRRHVPFDQCWVGARVNLCMCDSVCVCVCVCVGLGLCLRVIGGHWPGLLSMAIFAKCRTISSIRHLGQLHRRSEDCV